MVGKHRYGKPERFSDPFDDIAEEESHRILSCDYSKLGWSELSRVFPAAAYPGEYEECAYFIEAAMSFMLGEDEDGSSLIDGFIGWVANNQENLIRESRYSSLILRIESFFSRESDRFCIANTSDGIPYAKWGQHMVDIVDALNSRKEFQSLGDGWLTKWIESGPISYDSSAWRLYMVSSSYSFGVPSSRIVDAWRGDHSGNEAARDLITEVVLSADDEMLISYWDRALSRLGL